MFNKVLIANRGEIALRVIRTCRDLGIATVAVYSEIDADLPYVRAADEKYLLPGKTAAESYLNTEAVVAAIKDSGADALHPGYGFFSENADFANAIEEAGVTFIGPPTSAIETMGDKISSRIAARAAGVDGVPGTAEPLTGVDEVVAFGNEYGWPVAIKAAYGGGGRGMKVVESADEVADAIESATREAKNYFGRPELYMERFLTNPRHIEMQVFGDKHGNYVWLGERDCSTQRRHQKLIEESPAENFPDDVRKKMGEAAVAVTKSQGYYNAGTVEFLYQDGEFYFLEMNTRLQVEHPVTEEVTGLDLVEWQLLVAAGEQLPLKQDEISHNGHAIEIRINAEDVAGGAFLPSPGPLTKISWPTGPGIRIDAGFESGNQVSPYYDNLIAKLVVWGQDRKQAIARTLRALSETQIEGVATTIPADELVLRHPDFVAATHSTNWAERDVDWTQIATVIPAEAATQKPGETARDMRVVVNGNEYNVRVFMDEAPALKTGSRRSRNERADYEEVDGSSKPKSSGGTITVPMQGTVLKVLVKEGDTVEVGQTVCVLEAMKMENNINADRAGTISSVSVEVGQPAGAGDVICTIS